MPTHSATFRKLVEDASRQLVSTVHRPSGSFISTPLLYPSGASVLVRVQEAGNDRCFVSDVGMGYQEAEMMGASLIYARHARSVAEEAGVGFDDHTFFVLDIA